MVRQRSRAQLEAIIAFNERETLALMERFALQGNKDVVALRSLIRELHERTDFISDARASLSQIAKEDLKRKPTDTSETYK